MAHFSSSFFAITIKYIIQTLDEWDAYPSAILYSKTSGLAHQKRPQRGTDFIINYCQKSSLTSPGPKPKPLACKAQIICCL